MHEPGLDRHQWESELQALEAELAENPAETLPELDGLVARMLEETGYAIDDPVAREGDEREVVSEFLAARDVAEASERGSEELSPGDVGAAVTGYRKVFDFLVSTRAAVDADLEASEREQ